MSEERALIWRDNKWVANPNWPGPPAPVGAPTDGAYKEMVLKAWKAMGITQFDDRNFVQCVIDLVEERNELAWRLEGLER